MSAAPVRQMVQGDSLFARLLLTQALMVLLLAAVVGVFFYVERNVTVATLVADRWAGTLAQAAGQAGGAAAPLTLRRRDAPPPDARSTWRHAPRFAALREALQARGLAVDEILLEPGEGQPLLWLQLRPPGRAPLWLGLPGRQLVPEWSARAVLALGLVGALVVGASWAFTRRLTRPLSALRQRMLQQQPGAPWAGDDSAWAGAAPEIRAIGAAHAELQARHAQHERERALLLAGVSHDLRSPLGRIRLAAELLPEADPAVQRRRELIVRNVAEADRLIESFLDLVRASELPMDQPVDVRAVAQGVVAQRSASGLDVQLHAPPALPPLQAHPLLLERLLANLVDNALRHGRPPVQVGLADGPDGLLLWVDDHGDGLPAGRADELLQAFARGDPSRGAAGSGLGLSVVQTVLRRLGGRLAFSHAQGVHRVQVLLPRPAARPPG
jgi:two-component system osmolarity sensor histidine kinase EnvZ